MRPRPGIVAALAFTAAACGGSRETAISSQQSLAAQMAFRPSVDPTPANNPYPTFALSADYPDTQPVACLPADCPWLAMSVSFTGTRAPAWNTGGWDRYLASIFEYVKQGQDLKTTGWMAQVGGKTRWFHVPWQAYRSDVGREFIHGMTNERSTTAFDFAGTSVVADTFQSWAVGMYNERGGWTIGKLIPKSGPQAGVPQPTNNGALPFPEGTVVAKILFTSATADAYPFLTGSPEWMANIHDGNDTTGSLRFPQPIHLVQMDVAVTDRRSPSGWVFGTFVYNGLRKGATPWDNMQPLGLMWGNDPQSWPAVNLSASQPLLQSVLAPFPQGTAIYEHLGCGPSSGNPDTPGLQYRLAGLVDNRASSCVACHQTAFTPYTPTPADTGPTYKRTPPLMPAQSCTDSNRVGQAQYLRTLRYPAAYWDKPGSASLDFSLQLRGAFISYTDWAARKP